MANGELYLQYIEVLIWPLIFMIFFLTFKENIRKLIDRVQSVKGAGFHIETVAHREAKLAQTRETETSEEIDETVKPVIKESAERSKQASKAMSKTKKVLAQELSIKDTELDFERVYSLIFGSQLELLQILNTPRDKEMSLELVGEYYVEDVKNKFDVFDTWSLQDYLDFMYKRALIKLDDAHNTIALTPKGQDFLKFVEVRGYPTKKDL